MKKIFTLFLAIALIVTFMVPYATTYADPVEKPIKINKAVKGKLSEGKEGHLYVFKSTKDQNVRVTFDGDFVPYITISHENFSHDYTMTHVTERIIHLEANTKYWIGVECWAGWSVDGIPYTLKISSDTSKPTIKCTKAENSGTVYARWTGYDDATYKLCIADNAKMKSKQVLDMEDQAYTLYDMGSMKTLYFQAVIKLSNGKKLKTKVLKYSEE